MSINDILKMICQFLKEHGEIISFLFGGCGIGLVAKAFYRFRVETKKISEFVISVKDKGLYNKCNIVKKLKVEKTIKEDFPEYSDYLFVQYGSSVDANGKEHNDYDFIVLLLGHPKDNVKHVHNSGSYPYDDKSKKEGTNVDIVYRDYLSFLFAACAGMPYENSIIVNSKLLNGHKGYYAWLENITKNILIDRDFLLRRFDDKIVSEKETYYNEKKYHPDNKYDIVRAGYYYITSMIQREIINKKEKVLLQKDIVPLSKVFDIGKVIISDKTILEKYNKIIFWLKRSKNEGDVKTEYIDEVILYLCNRREYSET